MNNLRQRAAVIATAALAVGLTTAVMPTGSQAAGVTTRTVTKVHGEYLTTYHWANGETSKILDLRGGRIATLAPTHATRVNAKFSANSTATTTKTIHDGGLDVAPDASITGANKTATLSTPIANTSDAAMVQALGAPASVVQQFAAQDALDGTAASLSSVSSSGPAPAMTTTASQIKRAAVVTPTATGPIYNRTCSGNHFDNNQGGYYACWNQYVEHKYADGTWYMADHFYSSAYMHDTAIFNPDELTGLQQGVHYGSGNAMVDWAPKNTVSGGNCTQTTVTVGGFGQSYSTTYTKCPEVFGLHYISQWTFHTKWDGQGNGPNNGARDTSGVDTVHNAPAASPTRGIYLHYWYG